jgi:hypothetical protein
VQYRKLNRIVGDIKTVYDSPERQIHLSWQPDVLKVTDNKGNRIEVSEMRVTSKIFNLMW